MSSPPGMAPAGSSTYNSNTMVVGDGTWDTTRNTFLLPNLVGLNFATMRYNGMGNRFRDFDGYHSLILAHGIMAALTFLLIVPSAIMFMRYKRHRPNAIRFHIWLQILTFLMATALIIVGFNAVGPERSLTNPHHGIGVALYVMIVFQFLGGAWIRRRDRKKKASFGWMRKLLHHWLGRTIALLGIAQVALGLTLYGSPKVLFVLYALAVSALVLTYFLLEYRDDRSGGIQYDDRYSYSYGSGSVAEDRHRQSSGVSNLVKAGAAGIGLAALASRFRNRSRSRHRGEPEVVGSRRHSLDDTIDEKYSGYGQDHDRGAGWKDRLFKIGVVAGGAGLAKKYFDRRRDRDRDRDSDAGNYGPPLGGATAINPDHMERLEEGRPLPSNHHAQDHPLNHRRSNSSMSYSSYTSASQEGRGHGLRNTVAGLGAIGLARSIFKGRRERKGKKRLDVMREQERRNRTDNRRLTGDGFPRRGGRRSSITTSTFTDSTEGHPHHDPGLPPPLPPAGTFPVGAGAAGAAIVGHGHDRMRPGPPPPANFPPQANTLPPANVPPPPRGPPIAPAAMPPIPPDPQGGLFHQGSSISSADGRHHRRRRSGRNSATEMTTGLAPGGAANGREGSVASPPVSVKVKMHPDGRHVTLRRLPEEEAAAERAARRRSKDRHGRRAGADSVSSLSGAGSGGERWRRTEALERQQADQMRAESDRLAAARAQAQNQPPPMPVPPPPPIPGSATGPPPPAGSVSSPGNYDTEASADYANNRRRRRAERAQAKQARGGGNSVEFT